MSRRVVITGMGCLSPLGHDWHSVRAKLESYRNAVVYMKEWDQYEGLHARIGAPVAPFDLPAHFTRKVTRSMGRVALMATLATERALADAGLLGDPVVTSGRMGIAYGSSSGTPSALGDFARLLYFKNVEGITATTYLRMMSNTAAVNISVFFGITGRAIPTSSACTSGSQGIGYAYETIKDGRQDVMVAGGAEELDPTQVGVFDTLNATSGRNDAPATTPRPFNVDRDGLVLGEGAGTFIVEDLEHALARGARIHAEIVGYGTNCDGSHVTFPKQETMQVAMRLALDDAQLPPEAIGYINLHGTSTDSGDVAESQATCAVYGGRTPASTLKSYMGHTLGACGALEAWMSIEMMRAGWFHPTINLETPDPKCSALDYIMREGRRIECEHVVSNNFAFGGVNTSLIFKRYGA